MLQWFQDRWVELKEFLYALVLTVFDILKDLFFWLFESIMDLSLLALEGLDSYFDGLNITSYISAIPPSVSYVLNAIGLPTAMTMITTAIVIRMLLQLIPFTRLGS